MAESADRPWYIEGWTGAVTTYRELLTQVSARPLPRRPLCRPTDAREALLELTRALVAGADLTLVDTSFTSPELQALGLSEAALNQGVETAGVPDLTLEQLWGLVPAGGDFRLGLFSSGTTGLPKRVDHTLASLARAVRVTTRHRADVWGLAYGPTHVAGVQVWLQALANGNTLVDLTRGGAEVVLDAIVRHGVTHLSATPTFYRLLLASRRVLPGVVSVALGGEPSDATLHARLREMFPAARLHNIYASTEAGTLLESDGEWFTRPERLVGRLEVREGRLHVHRSLCGEFLAAEDGPPSREAAAGSSSRSATGEDDWYDTGDVVEVGSASPLRFRVVGRDRDWVNIGGDKVNPAEVEAVVGSHPGVRQARVFGRKNSVMGNILMAEVVAAPAGPRTSNSQHPISNIEPAHSAGGERRMETGADLPSREAELRAWLGERLPPYQVPRIIRFVDRLTLTASGKARRT